MLETIFEKILVNSLGPYVNGIDKKNLKFGVFGGDIVIEKISLKPEAIEMLGLPITLKFSFIGKLIIKLSLTSISSKPVEVILEDVFVNFQPVSKEAWKYTDEQMFVQKIGLVEDLVQNYTAMLIEKAKKANKEQAKPEEDQGMIGRLIEKIIDNIKISVKNIHVRFENPFAEKKYAMGITLDEIDVHTTDAQGKEQFFDRSKKENKLASLHKLAVLKDLGVYWTTTENTELYGNYAPDQALAAMRGFLESVKIRPENPNPVARKDYIISLSAECKVIQKSKKVLGMDKPDFDVKLCVATINTHLQRPQMENVIRLLEFFNKFERFKSVEVAKRQQQIGYTNTTRIQQGSERFKELFTKINKFANKDELKGKEKIMAAFDNQNPLVEEYKTLLIGLPEEDILKIVKRIVKEAERDKQLKAFDDKKNAQKGFLGGWGLWGGNKQDDMDPAKLDEAARQRREEQAKIEKELEEALGNDEQAVEYKKKDEEDKYILGLSFVLEGANIYLSSKTPNGEEGVNFYLTKLGVNVSMFTNNMKVGLGLRDFGLALRTKPNGSSDYNDTPILRRFKHWQAIETANDILALEFEDNPTGNKDEMFVRLDLHKLEFIFRSLLVERLGKFFDVSVQDEDLKSQAAEKIQQAQIKAAQKASEAAEKTTRKNVQIRLDAPMIVIPFLQNGDPNSECWTLTPCRQNILMSFLDLIFWKEFRTKVMDSYTGISSRKGALKDHFGT